MPNITTRQVEGQEMLDILYLLDNYAFRPTPPFPNREEWEARIKTRKGPLYYALFEDDDPVAVAGCPALTQNVRGKIFEMGGVADVSTRPAARRKRYIRELMRYAYEQLKNHGYALPWKIKRCKSNSLVIRSTHVKRATCWCQGFGDQITG